MGKQRCHKIQVNNAVTKLFSDQNIQKFDQKAFFEA